MANATDLVIALKRQLKERGITYADLAQRLGLSEASIKRIFSRQNLTLSRLEMICDVIGLELSELARISENNQPKLSRLNAHQEATLVADTRLLLATILTMNNWGFEQILAQYQFTPSELTLLLLQLERLGVLHLLPENRIRLNVSRNLQWQENGPVRRFFQEKAQDEFLNVPFTGPGEYFNFSHGMLTPAAFAHLRPRITRIVQDFAEQHQESETAPLADRYGCSLLIAFRPWELNVFEALRKAPDTRTLPNT